MKKILLVVVTALLVATPVSAQTLMRLDLDKTHIYKLPEPAGGIVIGNPDIAGVAIHDPVTLLLTGKSYGSTRLTVLNNEGTIMRQFDLAVGRRNRREVTIVHPGAEEDFICIGKCRKIEQVR